MKKIKTVYLIPLLFMVLISASTVNAATSPNLETAKTFTILASTYTNTIAGTTITGNVGYTTAPVVTPTITGNTYVADSAYSQAGIDQGNALSVLNSQVCTFTFAPGPIDLASDTTHGPVGVYTPGVYCMSGASSVGGGGTITLNGSGTYIFRNDGAFTTTANSAIVLASGASACNVWWTPTEATTVGANSTFVGTVIDAAGVTIGSTVTWNGSALAFGGTVSTDTDTIMVQSCNIVPVVVPVVVPVIATTTPIIIVATSTPIIVATTTPVQIISIPVILAPTSTIPKLPNTGNSSNKNLTFAIITLTALALSSFALIAISKKQKI